MNNIFQLYSEKVGKIVEVEENTHTFKKYVSKFGYTIPVTPKKNPYLNKKYEISEAELQYSELQYGKLVKALKPYIEKGVLSIDHKYMERSAHINILHTLPKPVLEESPIYWSKPSTDTFASFSLQKGALYNLPYISVKAFITKQIPDFESTSCINNEGNKYSIKTLIEYLNTIESIIEHYYHNNNLEYHPGVFSNFLYLSRNVKSRNCTEDLSLWVDALQQGYREDEIWFALNKTYITHCGGRVPPEIVKEYKTYLYLLKNS